MQYMIDEKEVMLWCAAHAMRRILILSFTSISYRFSTTVIRTSKYEASFSYTDQRHIANQSLASYNNLNSWDK